MLCKTTDLHVFLQMLQELDLENRKTDRKRPQWLEFRRTSGQINEKARGIRKTNTRGARKRCPGWHFQDFGQDAEKQAQRARKINLNILQNMKKLQNIGKHQRAWAKSATNRNMRVGRPNMAPPQYLPMRGRRGEVSDEIGR